MADKCSKQTFGMNGGHTSPVTKASGGPGEVKSREACCLELVQHLLQMIDRIKTNKQCCYRLRHLLSILSSIIAQKEPTPRSVKDDDPLASAEKTLYECLRIVVSISNRGGVSQVLFPRKNLLRNVELNIMQLNSSLVTAFAQCSQNATYRHLTPLPESQHEIPDANFQVNFPKVLKAPDIVSGVKISYDKGNVNISWNRSLTDIVDFYQIMRDDSCDLFPNISGYCDNVDMFYDPNRNFKPLQKYTIRVRAINSAGRSEWSEGAIVLIKEAPPSKPTSSPKLITFFCSSTNSTFSGVDSVRLSVPYPSDKECNGSPIEKIVIQYSNQHSSEHTHHNVYKCEPENGQVIVEIKKLALEEMDYTFAVVWCNRAGDSPPSDYIAVSKSNAVPSPPSLIWESSNKTGKSVKIRWAQPTINAFAIAKYEVQKLNSFGVFMTCAVSSKCSANIKHLKQRTRYVFRVCAVTASGERSDYSSLIPITTKLSRAARETLGGVAAVTGFTVGAAVGPIAGPFLGLGAAAKLGTKASAVAKNKVGKVAVGTSVAVATALPLAVFGVVALPVCAGGAARSLVVDQKFAISDQSSAEE